MAVLLALGAVAVPVAGCGGADDPGPGAVAHHTKDATGRTGWNRVVPAGDCQCSDGSEFSFWVRRADPRRVVLYLQEGGACFSAETCAPARHLYDTEVSTEDDPAGKSGIFDFTDERNPFADYSVVYVPYCTGDVHIGDTTTEYAPGLTVHHKGYVNGSAALRRLATAFPRATDVVVIGESAGSIAAPLYAGLVADRLPDARVTALAEGSGSYPDVPRLDRILAHWTAPAALPRWLEGGGRAGSELSVPGLFVRSGRHDPRIVFARHDHANDAEQASRLAMLGLPSRALVSLIDANEARIERAGVRLLSYVGPGREHVVLTDGSFYTERSNGRLLVDWVARLVRGERADDVHCRRCAA